MVFSLDITCIFKRKRVMRTAILIFLIVFLAGNTISAQEKLTKKEKKEKEKIEREAKKQELLKLVNSRQFVLEASQVQDKEGRVLTLTPMINFLMVEGDSETLQFGLEGRVGWNGLGGITLEGKINGFTVKEGKPGKYFNVTIRVAGAGMYSHQFLTVYPDGRAEMEVSGDRGGRFTFYGKVKPLSNARIYRSTPDNK